MSSIEAAPWRADWIALLQALRERVGQPDNDFGWTPWADAAAAKAELDRLLGLLQVGGPLDRGVLALLFAPTGVLQELALSSGWAEDDLRLAAVADRLLAADGEGAP